jgi:hypothetical protein
MRLVLVIALAVLGQPASAIGILDQLRRLVQGGGSCTWQSVFWPTGASLPTAGGPPYGPATAQQCEVLASEKGESYVG